MREIQRKARERAIAKRTAMPRNEHTRLWLQREYTGRKRQTYPHMHLYMGDCSHFSYCLWVVRFRGCKQYTCEVYLCVYLFLAGLFFLHLSQSACTIHAPALQLRFVADECRPLSSQVQQPRRKHDILEMRSLCMDIGTVTDWLDCTSH